MSLVSGIVFGSCATFASYFNSHGLLLSKFSVCKFVFAYNAFRAVFQFYHCKS